MLSFFTIRFDPAPSAEVFGGHKARLCAFSGTKIVKVLLVGAKIRRKFMGRTQNNIITKVKQQIAHKTGIPTSKAGLERKIGAGILKGIKSLMSGRK